jgi:arginyl-tRNA synthetase
MFAPRDLAYDKFFLCPGLFSSLWDVNGAAA